MFDSKEIAQRALKQSNQLLKQRKQRTQFALAAGVSTTACAAVIAFSLAATPTASPETITLSDNPVPLAAFPADVTELCPECEEEMVDGICEECKE